MEIPYFIRYKQVESIDSTDCIYLDDASSNVPKRIDMVSFAASFTDIIEPYLAKKKGSFYDTTTQTVTSGGIAAMKLNSTDSSATDGISITNNLSGHPTRITVTKDGVYDIQFSAQLERLSGGVSKQAIVWLRKNGTDVPDSATHVAVQANANFLVISWNFFIQLDASEYCELMWTQDDAIEIKYEPPNTVVPYPATPSVILTINEI